MVKRILLYISSIIEKLHLPGDLIENRYVVVRHLGSGSYGQTYLVMDQLKEVIIVLKTLRWHRRITKAGRSGFFAEMEMLANIRHSGFPIFFESGYDGKTPFYTMEYVEGHTFEQLIFQEGKTYNEVECFIVANQLLEMVDYLHQLHIVHRDLRIPNIMLQGRELKIIDMGLAKKVGSDNHSLNFHPRKQINVQSDYYGLGHFILFLLYSTYSPVNHAKERSWEEELVITNDAKTIIRRLLQIDRPYETSYDIQQDFQKIIKNKVGERVKANVVF